MNLELLDCTLRDGGYINYWQFNQEDILRIINSLIKSGIENIECGYLSNSINSNYNSSTKLDSIQDFNEILSSINKKDSLFYLMIDFNDYDTNNLPEKNDSLIDGIRLAFHKKDLNNIYQQAENIKNKGYQLFIQPMTIHLYSDEELEQLIKITENLNSDSLYIVDSFGCLNYKEIKNYFFKIDQKLNKNISLGLHLHNNIHSAFSHAVNLIEKNIERKIIVDTSITGMGRGAGNIQTEFMTMYLTQNYKNYDNNEILKLVDKIDIFNTEKNKSDIAYFISGIYKTHPSKVINMIKENYNLQEIYQSLK